MLGTSHRRAVDVVVASLPFQLCSESWLRTYLVSLSQIKLSTLPPDRQSVLRARRVVEEAEFAANVAEEVTNRRAAAAAAAGSSADSAPTNDSSSSSTAPAAAQSSLKEEEHQGRTTGSVEWRAARGELGADDEAVKRAINPDRPTAAASTAASAPALAPAACVPAEKAQCSTNPTAGALNDSSPAPAAAESSSAPAPTLDAATAASVPHTPTDAEKASAAKARTAALFRVYLRQVNVGCGTATCTTEHCRSNAAFVPPASALDAGKLAIQLTKTGEASLCKHNDNASAQP